MRTLIYEPDHGGHRLSGVRVLLEALREIDGVHVTIALSDAAPRSAEFLTQLAPLDGQFSLHTFPATSAGLTEYLRRAREKARSLVSLARDGRFEHVYMPYADGTTQVLAARSINPLAARWPSDVVGEGLLMRGTYAYPGAKATERAITLGSYRLSPWQRIHLIDPIPHQWIAKHKPRLLGKVSLLADPIETRAGMDKVEARRRLGIPAEGRYAGCVGALDERKGADLLLKAFANAKLAPTDRLLLGGKHSPGVREILNRLDADVRDRVISFDRYLSEDELHWATSALDLMATPYPGFIGSASIVIRAAVVGRPVLAADSGWMGYVVPKFGLGRVVNVLDAAQLTRAIEEELSRSTEYHPPEVAAKLAAFYSIGNVRAGWTSLIRERMGVPQRAGKVEWPDGAD